MRHVYERPNYRSPWTADDISRLADLLATGNTIRDIADVMGRSQEAVRNRATTAGLMPKRARRPLTAAANGSVKGPAERSFDGPVLPTNS